MPYVRISYINKQELSNSEIEFQVLDLEKNITCLDYNTGKYKNNKKEIDLDDVESFISKNDLEPEDVGFTIDIDEYIDSFFYEKSANELLEDYVTIEQIKKYITTRIEKYKENLFEYVSEDLVLKELSKLGYIVTKEEEHNEINQ